jgi:hypothetical protein
MNFKDLVQKLDEISTAPTGSAFGPSAVPKGNAAAPMQPSQSPQPNVQQPIPGAGMSGALPQTNMQPKSNPNNQQTPAQAPTAGGMEQKPQQQTPDDNKTTTSIPGASANVNADQAARAAVQQNVSAQSKEMTGHITPTGMTTAQMEEFEISMQDLVNELTVEGADDKPTGFADFLGRAAAFAVGGAEGDNQYLRKTGRDPVLWSSDKKPDQPNQYNNIVKQYASSDPSTRDKIIRDIANAQGLDSNQTLLLTQKFERAARIAEDIDAAINEFQMPTWQDTKDFVGNIGNSVVSDVKSAGDFVSGAANKAADTAKYAYNNPQQAWQDVKTGAKNTANAAVDTAKWAYHNPGQAIKNVAQTADDAVRAAANTATFGYADTLAAKGDSLIKGTNYDDELTNQYQQDVDAAKRSPNATTAGELAGFVMDPAFAGGAALTHAGLNAVGKGIAKTATRAMPNVAANVAKTGAALPKTTGTAKLAGKVYADIKGGNAADEVAKAGIRQVDPDNIYAQPDTHESINRLRTIANYRNT